MTLLIIGVVALLVGSIGAIVNMGRTVTSDRALLDDGFKSTIWFHIGFCVMAFLGLVLAAVGLITLVV